MAKNPALQLIEFFKVQSEASAEGLEREPMGLVMLSTEKSTRVSEALANLPQLDTARALSWVAAWKKAGFDKLGDGERMLLWHGSRTTNFAGILKQGLRIAPPEGRFFWMPELRGGG